MHRAHRRAAKVEFAQAFSNAALVQIDPEPAGDAIAQVNPAEAHDAILGKIGALFHPSFDLRLFGRAQARGAPAAGAVGEPADASLVIAMNPKGNCSIFAGLLGRMDHPRVGGETLALKKFPLVDVGPSPRGQGNHHYFPLHEASSGAIPAWAGKPARILSFTPSPTDDPRVGGETSNS